MKHLYGLAIGLLVCLFTACEHKELCYDHSHTSVLRVVFDWRDAPEAQPASMRLYLFPEEGGEPLSFEFVGRSGGEITVPAGRYRALCLNSDTESILFRNTWSYDSFEAYLVDGAFPRPVPRAVGSSAELVRTTPDRLWVGHEKQVEVFVSREEQVLTLYPQPVVRHYTVEIHDIENLDQLSSGELFGSLTGMSEGLVLNEATPTDVLATLPFDFVSAGGASMTTSFYTFGYPLESTTGQKLMVYAVLNDGKKYSFSYDVTSQIHEAPDPMNVHIVLYGLPLPEPIADEGGFRPDVDDWSEVEMEISM